MPTTRKISEPTSPSFVINKEDTKWINANGLLGKIYGIWEQARTSILGLCFPEKQQSFVKLNLEGESISALVKTESIQPTIDWANKNRSSPVRATRQWHVFQPEITLTNKRFVEDVRLPGVVLPNIHTSEKDVNAIELASYEPKSTGNTPSILNRIRDAFNYYITPTLFNRQDSRVKINQGSVSVLHCVRTETLDQYIEASKRENSGYTVEETPSFFGFVREITVKDTSIQKAPVVFKKVNLEDLESGSTDEETSSTTSEKSE
jgi:hypothetical protein